MERNDVQEVAASTSSDLEPAERGRFFTLSVDMLCIAGPDGDFRELNPAWTRTLGYTLDELRGQPFLRFLHPDDLEVTLRGVEQLNEGREVVSFRNRYRRRDGTYATIEWNASTGLGRGLIYAVGRDVTAYDTSVTALHAAHQRIQHLLHASRVVLYAAKPDSELVPTFVSDNVGELFGYEPEQFLGEPGFWADRIHPDDRARVLESRSQPFADGRHSCEYRWRRKDGAYRWMHDDCKVVSDAEGRPIELSGSWHDVTDRKEAERTIEQQGAALLELATPLIPISDRILVMPLIGLVDSRRAAQVLDTLLRGIADRQAQVAILDITGVSVVDTKVAETLLRVARAARLLGAEVVLTGIRPDVAQTLVGLDADLGGIVTSGTLQDGIAYAMRRPGAGPRR